MRKPFLSELSKRNKINLVLKHLQPGASILEIGSKDGWFAEDMRKHGFSVTTIDLFPPADIVGDITAWRSLGIREHSFDVCVGFEVIEHVDCLNALRTICKENGHIVLSSPHPNWDWVMKILEAVGLTQKRTSPHINLTDFNTIPLEAVIKKRPAFIHQVAIFRNRAA